MIKAILAEEESADLTFERRSNHGARRGRNCTRWRTPL